MSTTADDTPRTLADRAACRAARIRIQFALGRTFTRAQVAWLMAEAGRWGYEARGDDEYARGRRDAADEHVERSLDQLARAVTEPAFSADVAARGVAQRRRRELADMGRLELDIPPVRRRPVRPGVPDGCRPRDDRDRAAITVDPRCEWPAVAVPGGGA